MPNARGIRSEHPAKKTRVVHGILDVAPFEPANTFAPRQYPPKKPYANVVGVEMNAFEKKNSVDANCECSNHNQHTDGHPNLVGRLRLSLLCCP